MAAGTLGLIFSEALLSPGLGTDYVNGLFENQDRAVTEWVRNILKRESRKAHCHNLAVPSSLSVLHLATQGVSCILQSEPISDKLSLTIFFLNYLRSLEACKHFLKMVDKLCHTILFLVTYLGSLILVHFEVPFSVCFKISLPPLSFLVLIGDTPKWIGLR